VDQVAQVALIVKFQDQVALLVIKDQTEQVGQVGQVALAELMVTQEIKEQVDLRDQVALADLEVPKVLAIKDLKVQVVQVD
jgi:hypothetical protein